MKPLHISESILIHAPICRCFTLSTRVELVQRTLGMKLAGGVTSGYITAGSQVVWRGWKFGLPTSHHTLITGFEAPRPADQGAPYNYPTAWFQDSQERGRFAFFQHDHRFSEHLNAHGERLTILVDDVRFALPFGPLGRMVAAVIMAPYIRKLAQQRFAMIKELAESDGWREWVEEDSPDVPKV